MAIASQEKPPKQPTDCDCQNLFSKLQRKPTRKCCKHSKCTVAQLLKLCQLDPDCIMNLFKIAEADEKCLPDVEIDHENCDRTENDKYHFLMVDNATQYDDTISVGFQDRINEVRNVFKSSFGAPTATDTDKDRFDNIVWTVSVNNTPDEGSVQESEPSLKISEISQQKSKTEGTVSNSSSIQNQEQLTGVVNYNHTRISDNSDSIEKPTHTVKHHIEKMNAWLQQKDEEHPPKTAPISGETDSFTKEIFKGKNSPVGSDTQNSSILRNMGKEEPDSVSMNRKSIKQSFIDERGKSIIWSDNTLNIHNSLEDNKHKRRKSEDTFSHLSLIIREHKKRLSSASLFTNESIDTKKEQPVVTKSRADVTKGHVQIVVGDEKKKRGSGLWQRFRICIGSKKK